MYRGRIGLEGSFHHEELDDAGVRLRERVQVQGLRVEGKMGKGKEYREGGSRERRKEGKTIK